MMKDIYYEMAFTKRQIEQDRFRPKEYYSADNLYKSAVDKVSEELRKKNLSISYYHYIGCKTIEMKAYGIIRYRFNWFRIIDSTNKPKKVYNA